MKAVFKSGTAGGSKNPFERFVVSHPMGDIIFSEGDIGTEMFIIQSGIVELFKSIGGETRVLATLEKGDFFGEMSVLEDVPRNASARAKTDVEVVRINGATFDTMLKSNTEIAIRMYLPFLVFPYQWSPSRWKTFVSVLTQTIPGDGGGW